METLDLTALKKALARLDESVGLVSELDLTHDSVLNRTLISGVIQHFEFTYELSWKFIKRWLTLNLGRTETEGLSRRALFRLAHEYKLINSVEKWMEFHQARNLTSHTYDEVVASDVLNMAKAFLPYAQGLFAQLEANND